MRRIASLAPHRSHDETFLIARASCHDGATGSSPTSQLGPRALGRLANMVKVPRSRATAWPTQAFPRRQCCCDTPPASSLLRRARWLGQARCKCRARAAPEEPRTRLGSRHPPCRLPGPQLAARVAWDARLRAWADARSGFGRHVPKSPISLPVTLQARARRRPSLSRSRSPSRSPDPKPSPDPDPSTDPDPKPKPTPKTNQARARRRPRCHLRAWPVERWRARKRARRWRKPKHQHQHRQCRSSPVR